MSLRSDLSVQSGGTGLSSGALLIGTRETSGVLESSKGSKASGTRTLDRATQAPVTFVPEEDPKNPVSAKPRHTLAQTVSGFFRKMARPVGAVALGAALLLSGGCASMQRQGTVQPVVQPMGVPAAHASVVVVEDDQVKISDLDVQLRIQNMNRVIMKSSTPAMAMITRSEHVRQTVTGDYKKNTVPEFVVEQRANGKFVGVFLLPVSGHVGSTLAEQQENARHYAEIDRHKIWIKYPDGSTKVLAENLDPKGELTHAIRLEIELPKGRSEIVFSPLPEGRPELTCHDHRWPVDPDGFGPGRRQIFNVE